MKKLLLLLLILFTIPFVTARSGHMTLLAVSEKGDNVTGTIADLYLEIVPGNGRVFIDTYPLTKLDTQMSTRFAKQIACDFLDKNCNDYDFFYTIRARSAIIGGPSASGAATVLTVSLLENLKLNKSVAMTGTINSGGLIGPVGGVKPKIEAAKKGDIKKVVVSEFSIDENISDYSKFLEIELSGVSNLEEAIYEFTGKRYGRKSTLSIDSNYQRVMKKIAEDLCDRAANFSKIIDYNNSIIKSADGSFEKGKNLMIKKKYYSAASMCFSANIKYSYESKKNISEQELESLIEQTEERIERFEDFIDNKEINTLTDLQTFMIVKERIIDAKQSLNNSVKGENLDERIYSLTFAIERLNSGKTWARFYDTGKRDTIQKEKLKDSCINKLAEAEERLQYVNLYIPIELEDTREELDLAHKDAERGDYELCLFKASKAKADADLLLTTLRLNKNQTNKLIEKKLELVEQIIAENEEFFPIIGYSYYEYAKVLKEEQPSSSLIFLEYALELSNLDLYFKEEEGNILKYIDGVMIFIFSVGLASGILIGYFLRPKKKNKIKF